MDDVAVYGVDGYGRVIVCLIMNMINNEKKNDSLGFFDDNVRK